MLILISIVGIFYRLARILVPAFSRHLLGRKLHGSQLARINLTSGECFVLEMIVDNLAQTPKLIDQVFEEIEKKLTEKQRSELQWKIAEVEDGYKGGNISLNTSGYKQETYPMMSENYPLNASAPTEL